MKEHGFSSAPSPWPVPPVSSPNPSRPPSARKAATAGSARENAVTPCLQGERRRSSNVSITRGPHSRVPDTLPNLEQDRHTISFAAEPHGPPGRLLDRHPQPIEDRTDLSLASLGVGRRGGQPLPGEEEISGAKPRFFQGRAFADLLDDDARPACCREATHAIRRDRRTGRPKAEDGN